MLGVSVELMESDDPRWDHLLERAGSDVYHQAGYHRFCAEAEGARAFLAVCLDRRRDQGFIWPYLLKPIEAIPGSVEPDGYDVGSVYGYPGPLGWGCHPGDDFMVDASRALVEAWREQRAVSAFTRFNPVLGNVRWGSDLPAAGPGDRAILRLGDTVAIDLHRDDESAVAAYSKTLRQDIARTRRAGMVTLHDEDWSCMDIFVELYRASMKRIGASESYSLTTGQIQQLRDALGPNLHLFVTEMEGRVAVAGLFTETRGIVQAHLVGTAEEFLRFSPLKLLFDDVRRWARQRGDHVLHLGGGRGGHEDSLFAFKGRFSPLRLPFHVGRWVLDPARYAGLVARAGALDQHSGLPFFPPYRSAVSLRGNPLRTN